MTRQLVSEACIESLISDMLRGGNPLTVGVGIIIEVIRKNNSDYDPDVGAGADSVPSSRDPIYLGTLLRMFAKHVPDFMELILSANHRISSGSSTKVVKRELLKATFGDQIEPLGFDRFKTCELMAELLHCSNMGLLNEWGSESYVRQRDQERERRKTGRAGKGAPEGQSGTDATQAAKDSHHRKSLSRLGSESPDEIRKLEVANGGDDDGFEDVGSSGILTEDVKDDFDEESSFETRSLENGQDASLDQEKSRLDFGDEFVDEPLSSPRLAPSSIEGKADSKTSAASPARSKEGPLSPTSSGLTEKVWGLDIDTDTVMTNSSIPNPPDGEEHRDSNNITDVASGGQAPKENKRAPPLPQRDQPVESESTHGHDRGDLSPHPDDKPAPLFASRSDQTLQQNNTGTRPSENHVGLNNSSETIDTTQGEEGDSVKSILLSGNEQEFESHVETDIDGQPVVGDFLKMMFVEHRVVPTILVSSEPCNFYVKATG